MEKNKIIGVVGAGVMGKGVAQRFAQYGFGVILHDISEKALKTARREISRAVAFAAMMNKELDVDGIVSRISFTNSYEGFENVDFVVENVTENEEIKISVYQELEKVCKEECIYMVNTSCIPITKIGSITSRKEKVMGVHFMNPVPMKNFAESIRGWYTSEETIEAVKALLNEVDIETEVVNDSAGFVSNRISHLYMNEAMYLIYEGVAEAKQIDNIFKKAFAHKMGPLETADLIGLDTVLDSLEVLYHEYEDPKYRACPLLKRMVEAGLLGRKSGEGFYKY